MKKRIRIICAVLAMTQAGLLCSCSGETEQKLDTYKNASQTSVISAQRLEELNGEEKTDTVSETNKPKKSSDYEYKAFVLSKAGKNNAVFSGEAFKTQLEMMSAVTGAKTDDSQKSFLSLENSENISRFNRIWTDNSVLVNSDKLSGMCYETDMQSPSLINERNAWIKQNTNGFMQSLPMVMGDSIKTDITSVMYFHDIYTDGAMTLDEKQREFTDADGMSSEIPMLKSEGNEYYELQDASAYKIPFKSGAYAMIVLPDADKTPFDIDLTQLMSEQIAPTAAHVRFFMPEITVESAYSLNLKDFGIQSRKITSSLDSDEGISIAQPSFTHVAKVVFTKAGCCEDYSDSVQELHDSYDDDLNVVNFICAKPFMFYIYDNVSEEIMFFGVVNKVRDSAAMQTPEPKPAATAR